jgi:hypothetical protein
MKSIRLGCIVSLSMQLRMAQWDGPSFAPLVLRRVNSSFCPCVEWGALGLGRLAEMLLEQLPCAVQAFFCEHYRLGRGCRVGDVALGVKIVQRVPVMALPCADIIMQREIKQSKDDLIDFVLIVFHGSPEKDVNAVAMVCCAFFVRAPLRCAWGLPAERRDCASGFVSFSNPFPGLTAWAQ